ncbi:hypothetical protein JCM10296v2_001143 [Rhodotorula toruloides]
MCRAVTCLSYCIAVTTKSLLFAAEAYPTLESTLRFLDLVSLRVRRGSLQIRSTAAASAPAIGRLPLELWDLLRHELVELELLQAERRIAWQLKCTYCQATSASKKLRWLFPQKEALCEACSDLERSFEGILSPSYKLEEYAPMLYADSRTATFVALTPAWTGSKQNALEQACDAGNYDYADEQSVVDVSFRIPPRANERFKALVKRYHIRPVQISDGILAHKHTKKANDANGASGQRTGFQADEGCPSQVEAFLDVRDELVGYLTMCRATTHIFFGLPIRTWSLVPAADAWPKLAKTLRFFDLITLRILSGTLSAVRKENTGPSAVERVPVEVWDVAKHKLVDLELQDANDQLMRDANVNEWSCWGSGLRKPGKTLAGSALPPLWDNICSETKPCDMFSRPIIDFLTGEVWDERFPKLQKLLGVFGLCVPFEEPVPCSDDRWDDLDSATYVALLEPRGACTTSSTQCTYTSSYPDEQRVIEVDSGIAWEKTTHARELLDDILAGYSFQRDHSSAISILDMPPELLQLVRSHLLICAWQQAETELLNIILADGYTDPWCEIHGDKRRNDALSHEWEAQRSLTRDSFFGVRLRWPKERECTCLQSNMEEFWLDEGGFDSRPNEVLLQVYGLKVQGQPLPLRRKYSHAAPEAYVVPLWITGHSSFRNVSAQDDDAWPRERWKAADLSQIVLDVPTDAVKRFKRFLLDFDIPSIQASYEQVGSGSITGKEAGKKQEGVLTNPSPTPSFFPDELEGLSWAQEAVVFSPHDPRPEWLLFTLTWPA